SVQTLHLRHVAGCDVRIGDIENVTLKVSVGDELFNGFAVFRTSETLKGAKDLVEPRASFSQDILEIGLEIAIVDERYQHPGIVVDQRRAEVVHGANRDFPRCRLGVDLRQALAEQFCSVGGNFADEGDFSLFPDALARPIRLTGHVLRLCCTFVLDHFRVHGSSPYRWFAARWVGCTPKQRADAASAVFASSACASKSYARGVLRTRKLNSARRSPFRVSFPTPSQNSAA